jgi:ABC-2 type transport system ATP-binding protein
VLFAKVYDVDPDGNATLVQGLVAPARLTNLPTSLDQAESTAITLPALAHSFQPGHQLRVVLSSTDQGFATPADAATYQVALADGATGALSIPDVTGQPAPEFTPRPERAVDRAVNRVGNIALIVGGIVAGLLVIAVVVLLLRRRRTQTPQW